MEIVAISRVTVEGALTVLAAAVLFFGSVFLLLAAVFGPRMGYLVGATSLFGFMLILSVIWVFGVPGSTPPFRGPRGEAPAWVVVAQGPTLSSEQVPVQEYPRGPWREPGRSLTPEVEPATLAFQEFLATQANRQLGQAGIQDRVEPDVFEVEDLRFTTIDGTQYAVGRAFAETGGPVVLVVGYKDPGFVALPSFLFLAASVIGLAVHLPFLDLAERRRKEILTGGEQKPWLGPA
ncbi:MAG: hypothetical protein ACRDIX_08490 [Actinomycetota bacterium]